MRKNIRNKKRGKSIEKVNRKDLFIVFIFVFVLLGIFIGLNFLSPVFSGQSILNIEADYSEGQLLEGVLKLSLKEGELIPATSKIIFKSGEEQKEYNLTDFVLEDLIEGDFYVEGTSVSGQGLGYGIEGVKKDYSTISFILDIDEKTSSSSSGDSEEKPSVEEPPEETLNESVTEELPIKKNETENTGEIENQTTEEPPEETSNESITEEPLEETPMDELQEECHQECEEVCEPKEACEEVCSEEESCSEECLTDEEGIEQCEEVCETEETCEEVCTPGEETCEEVCEEVCATTSSPSIMGNVIKSFTNLFGATGRVAMEFGEEVQGEVSKENPFIFELSADKIATIKSGSVLAGSEILPDDTIELEREGNRVTVTTDYYSGETGFGENYLGEEEKLFVIDLSGFDLICEQDSVEIILVSEDNQEIASLVTILGQESIINESSEEDKNKTQETNETLVNKTITNETKVEESIFDVLTKEERELFIKEFGNDSVKVTKAEIVENGAVVKMELQNYWIELFYDSGFVEDDLNSYVQSDLIFWIKDILNELSSEIEDSEEIEGLIGKEWKVS